MEGKAIGMLAAFFFIACFAGGLSYYLEIDSKQNELSDAKALLATTRVSAESKPPMLESARARNEELKDQIAKYTALTDSKQSLAKDIATLESQIADVAQQFVRAVESVRVNSAGISWPDITLAGGQTYTNVTIQKITDTEVNLIHSGGLTKVPAAELPADIKERFRLGMSPMNRKPSGDDGKGKSAGDAGIAPALPAVANGQNAYLERVARNKKLDEKIRALQAQIVSLDRTRSEWAMQANQHRKEGVAAQGRGRPSNAYFSNANAADAQASAASRQIDALRAEIASLQSKYE
jgi:hypothetical protein